MMDSKRSTIAVVTTCDEDWGGSEELWGKSIPFLLEAGYDVTVYKRKLNAEHREFVKLLQLGVKLQEVNPPVIVEEPLPEKNIWSQLFSGKPVKKEPQPIPDFNTHFSSLLSANLPKLVIISQGINFDGVWAAYQCYLLKVPYILISQKAVEAYWPDHRKTEREGMRMVYLNAVKTYFVAEHNRQLTEEQFATRLPNAEVISNPIKVARKHVPYPAVDKGFRLACIGRYFLLDKGQDILIRIMSQPKWKERDLTISFIGHGIDKDALTELAQFVGADAVKFLGQVDDIANIWTQFHGLVLPSRSEGTPLVLLEAMSCGRVAIVSNAGGNGECITDGQNGFVGEASLQSFEEAMERAWQHREQWDSMGQKSIELINKKIPHQPEQYFAKDVLNIIANL